MQSLLPGGQRPSKHKEVTLLVRTPLSPPVLAVMSSHREDTQWLLLAGRVS